MKLNRSYEKYGAERKRRKKSNQAEERGWEKVSLYDFLPVEQVAVAREDAETWFYHFEWKDEEAKKNKVGLLMKSTNGHTRLESKMIKLMIKLTMAETMI